jgi:hypothetical protein
VYYPATDAGRISGYVNRISANWVLKLPEDQSMGRFGYDPTATFTMLVKGLLKSAIRDAAARATPMRLACISGPTIFWFGFLNAPPVVAARVETP